MRALLPCGKMEYAPYALGENTFSFYDGRCCYGKCPKRDAAAKARLLGTEVPKACWWEGVFGGLFCPLEATDQPFSWQVCTHLPHLASRCLASHHLALCRHVASFTPPRPLHAPSTAPWAHNPKAPQSEVRGSLPRCHINTWLPRTSSLGGSPPFAHKQHKSYAHTHARLRSRICIKS